MSLDSNRDLVRRMFTEVDTLNFDSFNEICANEYKLHFPGVPVPLDLASAKGLFGGFLSAFPGLTHRIEDMIAEDDRVAIRLLIRGKQGTEFQGIPNTGKEISLDAQNIFHISGGRIVEHWVAFDSMTMLQQLGVAPGQSAR